jgi:hypothetical protein
MIIILRYIINIKYDLQMIISVNKVECLTNLIYIVFVFKATYLLMIYFKKKGNVLLVIITQVIYIQYVPV